MKLLQTGDDLDTAATERDSIGPLARHGRAQRCGPAPIGTKRKCSGLQVVSKLLVWECNSDGEHVRA